MNSKRKPELLAPAGQPDAGYAAFHYGADAVYLGLNRFSARAEAVNFTAAELAALVDHAHALMPRRNVYLTLNTLLQADELDRAAKTLVIARDCGVDAVIVQDLGIARLVREHFPEMHLHASTQMAIHNLAGAIEAKRLGCSRVTLARELTLAEVKRIVDESGLEIETFIHGTLCYSYSGLCLFSSVVTGRSGNRGRCVYSCREAATGREGLTHPFSLKDMALGPRVLDLARAGVASLKIEGRKKSPLYVAATVDYYRRILDGKLKPHDAEAAADRLKTIFARPWTELFIDSRRNPDVADTDIVGHRGAPLGVVERLVRTPAGPGIAFTPRLAVERHDGLQIDLPGQPRPFGFAIDNLYALPRGKPQSVFASGAGETAAVALPEDAPALEPGFPLYLSSSQEVKRSFPFTRPKANSFGKILPADVAATIAAEPEGVKITALADATMPFGQGERIKAKAELTVQAFPARDAAGPEQAARRAFERTGGSRFSLDEFSFINPDTMYVKPGDWNQLRRDVLALLEKEYLARVEEGRQAILASLPQPADMPHEVVAPSWSLAVSRLEDVALFTTDDFARAEEIIVTVDPLTTDATLGLSALAEKIGREKIRLALPLILRSPADEAMTKAVDALAREGWRRWLIPNPGGFVMVDNSYRDSLDLMADWTLYCLNPLALEELAGLGCKAVTLSPEDDKDNLRDMAEMALATGLDTHIVVYSDLPLFISAACAHLNLGRCSQINFPEKCQRNEKKLALVLENTGGVDVVPLRCGSLVTGAQPFSLGRCMDEINGLGIKGLRIDLRWSQLSPSAVLALWRDAGEGRLPVGIEANFLRGLL